MVVEEHAGGGWWWRSMPEVDGGGEACRRWILTLRNCFLVRILPLKHSIRLHAAVTEGLLFGHELVWLGSKFRE
jgi:hypothetical protein